MSGGRILLGTIASPHGVKGAVRIRAYTAEPSAIAEYGVLADERGRTFEITEYRADRAGIVARIKGVDDRNAAEVLKGTDLYVDRAVLPDPDDDEFYHDDLIGLVVSDRAGEVIGTVKAVFDHGAGAFLEIAPAKGQTWFIPFTNDAVPVIDIEGGRLVVDPPPETEARPEGPQEEDRS